MVGVLLEKLQESLKRKSELSFNFHKLLLSLQQRARRNIEEG